MDNSEKARLKHFQDDIVHTLDPKLVVDLLLGRQILGEEDYARILVEPTTFDMSRKLLQILYIKATREGVESAYTCLMDAMRSKGYEHLVEKIELAEIPNDILQEPQLQTGSEQSCVMDASDCPSEMDDWTPPEVYEWLCSVGVATQTAQLLLDEEVSGKILRHITKEDLRDEFPDTKFKDRKLILIERNAFLKGAVKTVACHSESESTYVKRSPSGESQETTVKKLPTAHLDAGEPKQDDKKHEMMDVFRRFNTSVGLLTKYKEGAKLPPMSAWPDSLIDPFHLYIDMTASSEHENLYRFVKNTVEFIGACLNERTNGTIHFGVQENGTIVGRYLDPKKLQQIFTEAIEDCFFPDQHDAVKQCVRTIKSIPVILMNDQPEERYVYEIDVVPSHIICKEDVFFLKVPKMKKRRKRKEFEKSAIYRFNDGRPSQLDDRQIPNFMATKKTLAERRLLSEQQRIRPLKKQEDLRSKLVDLLSSGYGNMSGDLYHILVLSPPDDTINTIDMQANFQFLAEIPWKLVFDFDPDGKICQFLQNKEDQVMHICMSDDFDPKSAQNRKDGERLNNLHEHVKNSQLYPWVFSNGYKALGNEAFCPRTWKRERYEAFKETMRFICSQVPQQRALVVFLLLSKHCDVLLESASEICVIYPDQWAVITESSDISSPWLAELLRRNCIDKESTEHRCVAGMPWGHIQQTVKQMLGHKTVGHCELATSTGAFCELNNKEKNMLTDLEILSRNECDNAEICNDKDEFLNHERKVQEKFFRGGRVDWWNFWFKSHVCPRDIHEKLLHHVQRTLDGSFEDENFIGKVSLYHQPGAGGTTTSRNILWDLRREYRCAIVNNITDETCTQILRLRSYNESENPKPVLLLIDNEDEERVSTLIADMEEQTKSLARSTGDHQQIICVFMICLRRSSLLSKRSGIRFLLKHELTQGELTWFKKKHKELEMEFDANEGPDPKMLISFNILKENFDTNFIKETVKNIIQDIHLPEERTLLKYIAFLNTFDPGFQAIPTAAFDLIMLKNPWAPRAVRGPNAQAVNRWEIHLGNSAKILLNETSRIGLGSIQAFQIINTLLSKTILQALMEKPGGHETLSEVALQFLDCSYIFDYQSNAVEHLLNIVRDVLKKRERQQDGTRKKFAPLILEIKEKESVLQASEVMIKGFQRTNDGLVAQQIARLFIFAKNWEKATEYAKLATEKMRNNSYVLDTLGQVYKMQIGEIYNDWAKQPYTSIKPCDAFPLLKLASQALLIFKRVQKVSARETYATQNIAGFIGELGVIVSFLDSLTFVSPLHDSTVFRKFLLDANFIPPEVLLWGDVDGEDCIKMIKELKEKSENTIQKLGDEHLQLRVDTVDDYRRNEDKSGAHYLIKLKETLDEYFGEQSDRVPEGLSEAEACQFRRRRIIRLAGHTMYTLFNLLSEEESGKQTLLRVLRFSEKNTASSNVNAGDLQTFISVTLALVSSSPGHNHTINFRLVIEYSRKLYKLRNTSTGNISLEPYLFYVMFNWPRRSYPYFVSPVEIREALRQWKDAFYMKYPRQREGGKFRKKETTMWFLAYGSEMESLVSSRELSAPDATKGREVRGEEFWKAPHVLQRVQRSTGVLYADGSEVKVDIEYAGNKDNISIPTSMPIRKRDMWNKKVYFVIGFSWSGPKAYDIRLSDPTEDTQYMAQGYYVANPSGSRRRVPMPPVTRDSTNRAHRSLLDTMRKLQDVYRLEDKKSRGGVLTDQEKRIVNQKAQLEGKRDKLVLQRNDVTSPFW